MAAQSGVYGGMSAQERTAARRARLLEATLAVWSEPHSRVTMTAVCAEAGLTERYFYESFAGLEQALTAVLDTIAAEIEQVTLAAANAAGEQPADRVRASVAAFLGLLVEDPRKGRVAIVESLAVPALRERRQHLLRHFARRAVDDAGMGRGLDATPSEREVAGLLFIGGMAELVAAWLGGTLETSPEEIVDAATRMFLGTHA